MHTGITDTTRTFFGRPETLEKSIVPFIYNSKHTKHTQATRVQDTPLYSDGTTHSKQHRSKGVQPNGSHVRTITVALVMSKAFDTINIHTLIRSCYRPRFQAQSLSSSQTTSKDANTTQHIEITQSSQRQFKTGVPQGGVLSLTLFNIYTADIPPPRAPVQVMAYADNITITSTHTSTSAAKKYIQPYLHKVFAGTKQNNFTLNPDKTTCTLFTPDHAEYKSNLDLKINNTAIPMATHPKVLSLTLDPKLTYNTHIHISVQEPGMRNFRNHPDFQNFDFARGYSCESSRSSLIFWGWGRSTDWENR